MNSPPSSLVKERNMSLSSTRFLVLIYLLCIVNCRDICAQKEKEEVGKVYIVYLGHKEHDDIQRITNSHYDILAKVLGSKEAATKSMVYSYRHGFSGFAAKLTKSEAEKLQQLPEVIDVTESTIYTKRTTRTFEHLGLSIDSSSNKNLDNLLHRTNGGDGMIIGIIDSGIWPESKSFNDQGLGPIPSRWKGACEDGADGSFYAKKHCNRKVIGARWYMRTMRARNPDYNATNNFDFYSPRDGPKGHGTHIAGTSAGSVVPNVSYSGMSLGTVHGAAPKGRIASYKVCWCYSGSLTCWGADMLAAMDQAISDGVDVMQISLGEPELPVVLETEKMNAVAMGAYHAFLRGITVVAAAGNLGPTPSTVSNLAPWVIDVGASTIDRSSPTPVFLSNNITLVGQSTYDGRHKPGQHKVHYDPLCRSLTNQNAPEQYDYTCEKIEGKVFVCFEEMAMMDMYNLLSRVTSCRGIGVLTSKPQCDSLVTSITQMPFQVSLTYQDGCKLSRQVTESLDIKVGPAAPLEGRGVPVEVAYFSSRGPSSTAPEILKPDIVAPGANILAATSEVDVTQVGGYSIKSGSSMAAPHVSGIVLLLKSLHPEWSPANILSAIVTTGKMEDDSGHPIFANGDPPKVADPFDMGGGIINPNAASDPGLVYEMGSQQYEDYLCAMRYRKASISRLVQHKVKCPLHPQSLLNVNMPTVTIPFLREATTLTRTVTNVGPLDSVYKAVINAPDGTKVEVNPDVLVFNSKVKRIPFQIIVSPIQKVNAGFYTFGCLIWSDGVHNVRSHISVKVEAFRM